MKSKEKEEKQDLKTASTNNKETDKVPTLFYISEDDVNTLASAITEFIPGQFARSTVFGIMNNSLKVLPMDSLKKEPELKNKDAVS